MISNNPRRTDDSRKENQMKRVWRLLKGSSAMRRTCCPRHRSNGSWRRLSPRDSRSATRSIWTAARWVNRPRRR